MASLARPQDVGAVAPSSGKMETRPGRFPVAGIPLGLDCVCVCVCLFGFLFLLRVSLWCVLVFGERALS